MFICGKNFFKDKHLNEIRLFEIQLNRFSTSRLFSHEAPFFVAEIFDNGKYKKHATNKIRSSRPKVFCKKGVLKNFAEFIGKHLCQSFFFNKVAALRPAILLKKKLRHRCFPVSFEKFIRDSFFIEHVWWLLL